MQGLNLTIEVRSGSILGMILLVMTVANLVRIAHFKYGLKQLYNCDIAFPSYKKEVVRFNSFPPRWREDAEKLSKIGHFYRFG